LRRQVSRLPMDSRRAGSERGEVWWRSRSAPDEHVVVSSGADPTYCPPQGQRPRRATDRKRRGGPARAKEGARAGVYRGGGEARPGLPVRSPGAGHSSVLQPLLAAMRREVLCRRGCAPEVLGAALAVSGCGRDQRIRVKPEGGDGGAQRAVL